MLLYMHLLLATELTSFLGRMRGSITKRRGSCMMVPLSFPILPAAMVDQESVLALEPFSVVMDDQSPVEVTVVPKQSFNMLIPETVLLEHPGIRHKLDERTIVLVGLPLLLKCSQAYWRNHQCNQAGLKSECVCIPRQKTHLLL